ncbi:MAG: hypothetical protein A2128_01395 [Candidatus Liptonbacteria bacterium GWC1_60_9]|uniref:Uncharacterized protein n=1 Tax=Candidatus Liptonbacteria bacterium GWC1_60_9 TaxID=1798645 RepID=A0A1G2C6G7_9BACT|nr:MAG: hypothetical protein A2128_01395 [Candidatus Liptonbacteria bacterium GWC1_60_9]
MRLVNFEASFFVEIAAEDEGAEILILRIDRFQTRREESVVSYHHRLSARGTTEIANSLCEVSKMAIRDLYAVAASNIERFQEGDKQLSSFWRINVVRTFPLPKGHNFVFAAVRKERFEVQAAHTEFSEVANDSLDVVVR